MADSTPAGGPYPLTRAVLAELQAEIAGTGTSVLALSKQLEMDYNTLRRHVNGERPMPVGEFFDLIEALGVDPAEFIRRARERAARTR